MYGNTTQHVLFPASATIHDVTPSNPADPLTAVPRQPLRRNSVPVSHPQLLYPLVLCAEGGVVCHLRHCCLLLILVPALQLLTLWMTRFCGGQWGMKDAVAVVWVESVHLEDVTGSEWEQRLDRNGPTAWLVSASALLHRM